MHERHQLMDDLSQQLKLPIGYEGRSYEEAVKDLDAIIQRVRTALIHSEAACAHKYGIALADAVRRPMGVVPDSADGLVTEAELDAAEVRRPRMGAQTESVAVNPTPREK